MGPSQINDLNYIGGMTAVKYNKEFSLAHDFHIIL
jgi:hypothetical protein